MLILFIVTYLLAAWGILLAGTDGLSTYDGWKDVGYALLWPVCVGMATYYLIKDGSL